MVIILISTGLMEVENRFSWIRVYYLRNTKTSSKLLISWMNIRNKWKKIELCRTRERDCHLLIYLLFGIVACTKISFLYRFLSLGWNGILSLKLHQSASWAKRTNIIRPIWSNVQDAIILDGNSWYILLYVQGRSWRKIRTHFLYIGLMNIWD